MITVILFALSILLGAAGAILMKIGAGQLGVIRLDTIPSILGFGIKMATNFTILGGMSMYFLSAALWLYLLTKLDISIVQPILALTYVVTPILAIFIVGENVPVTRWAGILVIILGVFIVARTAV